MKAVPIMSKKVFGEFLASTPRGEQVLNLYKPDHEDLYFIYRSIRKQRVVAAIEFGSGWSTVVIAKALSENEASFARKIEKSMRHPNPFMLMTVDASESFQKLALARVESVGLQKLVLPVISRVSMAQIENRICHVFESIPPFTADFVYLDGPDCDQVEGEISGFTVNFGSDSRKYGLPMSGDLIQLEPFFWPGTNILLDGRGANARFLRTHFKRRWRYKYSSSRDQHSFQLSERAWGGISKLMIRLKSWG